ncbi:uncharacterized protein LOC120352295 [Nilaparvata lugens]|uniref:uncharacterized protein LOC120352295 n=1 Tax=Nilaparvata lugens TaxID=108931 RepID=UPI00193D23A5|nr:uncharacterized protein LOC120352295 [Nilaparvata lugens]
MFHEGCCVFVLAPYFDAPNTENEWRKSIFGENWKTEKCFGAIVSINKCFGSVKWDIDGNTTKVWLADINPHVKSYTVQPALHTQAKNRLQKELQFPQLIKKKYLLQLQFQVVLQFPHVLLIKRKGENLINCLKLGSLPTKHQLLSHLKFLHNQTPK